MVRCLQFVERSVEIVRVFVVFFVGVMAVLGVLIGGLIIAMYLPIFQLGAVV